MTGFSFLGDADTGANPVGAGNLYVFSASPHNAVTPQTLSGYTTAYVGVSSHGMEVNTLLGQALH